MPSHDRTENAAAKSGGHLRTIAVIHGWAEGKWQSRGFRTQCEEAGYEWTDDARSADVIFAHSAGCYLVPASAKASLILLVGLPYWPHRALATSVIIKLWKEITDHRRNKQLSWWVNKISHNIWYILREPRASYHVMTKHSLSNLPDGKGRRVIVVRPEDETFTHPDIARLLTNPSYQYVTLPGSHDDCWLKPADYMGLIRSAEHD